VSISVSSNPARAGSRVISGSDWAFSHLDTAWDEILSFFASSSWV